VRARRAAVVGERPEQRIGTRSRADRGEVAGALHGYRAAVPPKQIFSISELVALIVNGRAARDRHVASVLLLLARIDETSVSVGRDVLLPETG
jgi:hypothetical protein